MNIIIDNEREACIGCNACVQVCPKSCINMGLNEEGFWYPFIDEAKCNNCRLCQTCCPINQESFAPKLQYPEAYGAWNLDNDIKEKSTSGGVFTALATSVLEKGGVVFGAAFNQNMQVNHIMVDSIDDLIHLRGSKYVQSNIGDTYTIAKKYIKLGKKVLFSGTPCQIAGLYSFLRSDFENLLTCDLVCKGVPSPKIFEDYLKHIEKKHKSKIIKYCFRDKSKGWKESTVIAEFLDGSKYSNLLRKDPFGYAFSKSLTLRPACFNCKFSKIPRVADITIADFWGVAKFYPELYDNRGTSLLIINSEKGQNAFEQCANMIFFRKVELQKSLENNKNATNSVNRPLERIHYFSDYHNKGYKYVLKKYMTKAPALIRTFKRLFKNMKF